MIPIQERFTTGNVNFGAIAGEDSQRLPRAYGRIYGNQAVLLRAAVVIAELTGAIAFICQQQSSRTPELKLRLTPLSLTIVDILRQLNHCKHNSKCKM
jgi:hypothetical protein